MAESPPAPVPRELSFLVHEEGDDVAVAVRDTDPGVAKVAYLRSGASFEVKVSASIPMGHKVALQDLAENDHVIEYGSLIGLTRHAIASGDLIHTHNLRSARWQNSV